MTRQTSRSSIDADRRRTLAKQALTGYPNGPGAPVEATELALDRVDAARVVVLVEGISDHMALDAVARRVGRDFETDGVAILPVGGAHALARFVRELGPNGAGHRLAGLYDADEADTVHRALTGGGLGRPRTASDTEQLDFFVCTDDLEDELIRALGFHAVLDVLKSQGDLGSFRTMQKQPAWRDRPPELQLRRFLVSGAKRKLRYARLLVEALDTERLPPPLTKLLAAV